MGNTTTRRPKTAPQGLGPKARRIWREITVVYDLRPDELRVLEDACREIDLIERLEQGLDGAKLLVKGSMGQPVANPLVQEIRQHRATLQRLLGSLKLPDDPAADGDPRAASNAARDAAGARWRRTG